MIHISTKTFEHAFSCAFRQWRALSHCRFVHGYALTVRIEFGASELDVNNWVVDFGAVKTLKENLEFWFDHKLVIAEDDPCTHQFMMLQRAGACELIILPATGCEAFAEFIYHKTDDWLAEEGLKPRVHVRSVEVSEHGANSAIYTRV